MRTVSIRLEDLAKMAIKIGFVGENEHTRVRIDCKKAFDEYPGAVATLTVQPPAGEAYPDVTTRDGDTVIWDVEDHDLTDEGDGEFQLSFVVDETVMKSYIGRTTICRSIMPAGNVPAAIDDWLTRANAALAEIPVEIAAALEEAKESGEFDGRGISGAVLNSDYTLTLYFTDGTSYTTPSIRGEKGKDFTIAKTFSSTAQMEEYTGTDIEAGDFVMINTGDTEDADNGKLFCYMPGVNILNTSTMTADVSPNKNYIFSATLTVTSGTEQDVTIWHTVTQGLAKVEEEVYYFNIGRTFNESINITTEQYDIGLRFTFSHLSVSNVTLTEKWGYICDLSGPQGEQGIQGEEGEPGVSPTASVTKSGGTATITITDKNGTTTAQVTDGATGETGASPVFSIGTVTTGDAGTNAAVTQSGTDLAPVLNFTIPKGAKGDAGNGDMLAPAFAEGTANAAGTYVTYNGGLYLLPNGHTANTTWANTSKTSVTVGGQLSDQKSAITSIDGVSFIGGFTQGKYIYTNRTIGTDISSDISTPQTNNSLSYVIIDCTPGTKITLNAYGYSNGRLWAFVDSSNKLLSKSDASLSATNLVITAPANAAKCIINSYTSQIGSCYIGSPVDNRIADTDKTLTVENKPADGKATGDKIKEANAYTDSVKAYIITEYAEIEQGIVNSSTGVKSSNSNAVRSKNIPVLEIKRFVKPVNYRVQYAAYNSIGEYVYGVSYAQTQSFDVDNFGKTLLANHPTVETVVISFINYTGGTASAMSVSDFYETDNKLYINKSAGWDRAWVLCDKLNNVIFENITLDASTSFDVITGRNFYKNAIVSIDATATLTGDDPATIHVTRRWANRTGSSTNPYYGSPRYIIGENGKRKNIQFRLPCGVVGMDNKFTMEIVVPSGSSVAIHSMSVDFDDTIFRESTIQMNAHGHCGYGGPANTEITFMMAAKLGYKYCITIPKVTNDGKYVCFHDDDNIQGSLLNPDGSAIDSQYQNIPISRFDYNDLMAFDAGVIRGQVFRGEKVPLVADFFRICAETGMHPMFSVHPALTSEQWQDIKAMAIKYNLLDKLNIKGGSGETISIPMAVFGNNIESYTLDVNSSTTTSVEYMDSLVETYGIDATKTKVGIEYFVAYATDERIAEVLEAGYFAAVANISSNIYANYVSYIEKGVTQFTDDYCPNIGLRWY